MARRKPIPRERIAAAVTLGALFIGLWVAVSRGLEKDVAAPDAARPPANARPTPSPAPRPASSRPAPFVPLTAAGAFDPEGDGSERDDEAGLAVDGRAETAWRTEQYSSFFKDGVGLVLDAGRRIRIERVVVDVPGPGARAAILLGNEREGPFATVARARLLSGRTRFAVARRLGRYVVIWIVDIPSGDAAEIAEVRVRARG